MPIFIILKFCLFYYSNFTFYKLVAYEFLVASAIGLTCHIPVLVFSIICFTNFGKGLLDKKRYESQVSVDWDEIFENTVNPTDSLIPR
jgi:hypothetical protein